MNEAYRQRIKQRTKELKEKYRHMDAEERRERIAQLMPEKDLHFSPFLQQRLEKRIKGMEEEYRHLATKEREEKIAQLREKHREDGYNCDFPFPLHMVFEDAMELVQDPEEFSTYQEIADNPANNTCVVAEALEYASASWGEEWTSCHFLFEKVFPNYEGGKYAGMSFPELNKEPCSRKKEWVLDLLDYAMRYARENPQSYDYDDIEDMLGPMIPLRGSDDPPGFSYWDEVEKIHSGLGKSSM